MPSRKPPSPKAPQEALRWLENKIPFTREERDALDERVRHRAFFVSNVAQLKLISEVHKAATKAVREGTTLDDFKREVAGRLTREWGGPKPAVVETIFRNGVQSAYNAGRLEQFNDPVVKRLRPYRAWAVVLDGRTTEFICKPLTDVVVPADSTFASSRVPPLHHRCRTGILALSREDAGERLRSPEHYPDAPVGEGFGGDPHAPVEKLVDLAGEPASLRRIFAHKQRERSDEE